MSILDNEGHDPQGLGNMPSLSKFAEQSAYIRRLERLLNSAANERDRLRADNEQMREILANVKSYSHNLAVAIARHHDDRDPE